MSRYLAIHVSGRRDSRQRLSSNNPGKSQQTNSMRFLGHAGINSYRTVHEHRESLMAAAWQAGWYYLAPGASSEYWVSWGDTWQGIQFITTEPRSAATSKVYVEAQGMQTVPMFGVPPKVSYWIRAMNPGSEGAYFVLRGQRVAD
jgi:hypothetical protein